MSGGYCPSSGRRYPKTIIDHSASLKSDFDNVLNTVRAGLSRDSKLPPNLRDDTAKGVTNSLAKTQSNRHRVKWSWTNEEHFTNVALDDITAETAVVAQDTIPLAQFNELYESYQELHAKLKAQSPDAMHSCPNSSRGQTVPNDAVHDDRIAENTSYSTSIVVKIVHQMAVTRMEGKNPDRLGEAISVTVGKSFSNKPFRSPVRLSTARLLDCGDVEISAHAEHRVDLERLIQNTAWHGEFEESLGPLPIETYKVKMHNMRIGCMTFGDRKDKSIVIKTLANSNFPVESNNGIRSIISDIYWCVGAPEDKKGKSEKATTALVIEFAFPDQANYAIARGMLWQAKRHACNITDGFWKCRTCQGDGHLSQTYSAEPRCGKCAGYHLTENCTSTRKRCILCDRRYPLKSRYFLVPPATERVAEIKDAVKMELDEHEIMFDLGQNDHPRSGTFLRQADDFGAVRIARETALQQKASVGPKREAEDALPQDTFGGEVKRMKQEDLEQEDLKPEHIKQEEPRHDEDSMALYRQPSPYIIHRSR